MIENVSYRRYLFLTVLVTILACVGMVYAASQSSADYIIDIDVIDAGGVDGSSADYYISHSTGQSTAIGVSSSSDYFNYAGFWYALSGLTVDADGDGVPDDVDNCEDEANSDQRDTNSGEDDDPTLPGIQHYGNACDPDFDNDGIVGLSDFIEWRMYFRQTVPPAPEYVDLDGNGLVGIEDFNIWRQYFRSAPGPGLGD